MNWFRHSLLVLRRMNWPITAAVCVLMVIGVAFVYGACYVNEDQPVRPLYMKQVVWAVVGLIGYFATWLIGTYVAGKTLQGVWSWLSRKEWFGRALPSVAALPHEGELYSRNTISLALGALVAAVIVYVYYRKPDVRQWADEVAEQLGKVKWPTRKDVGNYTVVVLAVSAVMTVYLALLDRFWGFLTNLIYSSGL